MRTARVTGLVKSLGRDLGKFLIKNKSTVMVVAGITGMTASTVLAVKATVKAEDILYDENLNRMPDDKCITTESRITKWEVVKLTWKCYAPSAVLTIASAACLLEANSENTRRNAALAAAYKLSETALIEYKNATLDTVGEKKEKAIREKIAENKMINDPITNKEVIVTGLGNTICYETTSSRYFGSDIAKIHIAEKNLNKQILSQDFASLNDLYDLLGLDHTPTGDTMGWRSTGQLLEFTYDSKLTDNYQPCLVIGYGRDPKYDSNMFA